MKIHLQYKLKLSTSWINTIWKFQLHPYKD